jgi:hypothetical protein
MISSQPIYPLLTAMETAQIYLRCIHSNNNINSLSPQSPGFVRLLVTHRTLYMGLGEAFTYVIGLSYNAP